jgi:hypothetical protein
MNRRSFVKAIGATALVTPLAGCRPQLSAVSTTPLAPAARLQKGISFTAWNQSDYAGPGAAESLRRLAATGAQ